MPTLIALAIAVAVILSGCSTTPGDAALRSGRPTHAADLYRQGAAQGDALAALKLGLLLDANRVSTTTYGEATTWFKEACDLGSAPGCHNVGVAYEYGKGSVSRDMEEARVHYLMAANRGYMQSQYNLGSLFANGYFKNDAEGYKWMVIAKDTAQACMPDKLCQWVIEDTPGHRKKLESRLSKAETDSIREQAKSWMPED